jgi:hypothetical protein
MMIYILLQWLFVFLILSVLGIASYRAIVKLYVWKTNSTEHINPPFWALLALGAAALTAVTLWLSIFIAISTLAVSIVCVLAVLYVILDRTFVWHILKAYTNRVKAINIFALIVFCIFFFTIASFAFNHVTTYDTWLYHDQTVKWVEQYPAVPGLGNLHTRFTFSTSHFVTNAFFENTKTYVYATFLYVLLLIIATSGLNNILKRKIDFSSILATSLFIPSVVFVKDLPSLSNDVGGSIFLFATFVLMLVAERKKDMVLRMLAVVLALFTVTIKLTFAPLGILACYVLYLWIKEKKYSLSAIYFGSIGLLLYVPFFIRNVIQSGYLVYPFKHFDVFTFDWKIPMAKLVSDTSWIQSWARVPGPSPDIVLGNGFWFWFNQWITVSQNKFYVLFVAVSLVIFVFYVIANLEFRKHVLEHIWIYITSVTLVIFWFIQAPDIRFGYGVLFIAIMLFLIGILYVVSHKISEHASIAFYFIFILCLLILFAKMQGIADAKQNVITVSDANKAMLTLSGQSKLISVSPTLLNGTHVVYVPLFGDWCLTSPLPCTPQYENGTLFYMRGSSLKSGFASFSTRS